ncbi:ABC transporter ATP-binding protein [Falsirhodobacter xinxiangensis]|uniref:ABC transporter ATP-binding protein n=1 Tax=Falsirhodobacter xinxiangensis TaxID=2530049 RepID=UPI0010AB0C1D|nr:ATP-binding cassette domain-containing protein [Rhodobacter xinxiangensis]
MADLELKTLRKSFGAFEAIKGVDLSVKDREFVVFVGPSGCGKSTLLRMIAGLETITSGDLLIDGARENDSEPMDRGLAMVFQSYALYPHMTVAENMGFALRVAKVPAAERERAVREAARVLELEHLLDRRPKELSGGQRQRVAIGRAIVRKPKVFLFDEPLSNLDAALRVNMRLELMRLHKRLDATMIYVTHDQTEAMTMADKIVVLRAGQIEQVGAPMELYARPANMFVAGFIGAPKMNFLPAGKDAPPGARTLGIRPEDLGPGDTWQGTVRLVERLGGVSNLHVELEDGFVMVMQVTGEPARMGERIGMGADPSRFHYFDAQERRLTAS